MFIASLVFSVGFNFLYSSLDFMKIYGMTDPMEMLEEMKRWFWPMLAIVAISLIFYTIIHYYVIYKPVDSSVNIFVAVYKCLKYLIPYLIIIILFFFFAGVAMIVGLFALIIGIFFSMLYVFMLGLFILPILMVEGNNIGNAIVRTFTLAHRRFGPNLGWTAVFVLILIVANLVLSSIILLPFSGSFFKILMNPADAGEAMSFMTNPWYIMLSALVRALFMPLTPIFAVIMYFNGKAREEDIPSPISLNNEPDKVRVEDLYAKPYSDDHPENPEK
jgi:hypothetical protein